MWYQLCALNLAHLSDGIVLISLGSSLESKFKRVQEMIDDRHNGARVNLMSFMAAFRLNEDDRFQATKLKMSSMDILKHSQQLLVPSCQKKSL